MGSMKEHLVNGIVSLVISVAITAMGENEDGYDRSDVLLAVAVSSFFSGFFTSYFAKSDG